MPAISKLKNLNIKPQRRQEPLWKGPEKDGITFSLLSRFLCCRERFRLLVVEGLKPADAFNARMEFGNMWHGAEEELSACPNNWESNVNNRMQGMARDLCRRFPMQQEQVNHWYEMCKALFPLYVEHWSKHPDVKDRTPLLQEQVFDLPYKLPSGRTVRLRGKWDAVDLIGKGKGAGIYIQENKTKSSIDVGKLTRQLSFDLQTMMYLVALDNLDTWPAPANPLRNRICGVRYNVIRRSAHKSVESMLKKVNEDRDNNRIGEWFSRWKVEVSPTDVAKFRRECLDPVLEQLCDWWEWVGACKVVMANGNEQDVWGGGPHWRHPYGVYNVLDEGGSSDLDQYLESGSEVGLQRAETLFPELT